MKEKLRKTGINILGDVPWGTHFCLFFQTKEDLVDILIPYFKAGLENNEFCLWVTSELLSEKEAKKAMRKTLPGFDQYLKKGQMEIVPHSKWYLKSGVFSLQRVLNAWIDKLNQGQALSYDGMRVTGNTTWLKRRDWRDFADYEAEVNNVIDKYRMIAICSYSLQKCGACEIIDVVSNHQFALIRREGKWEIIESSKHKQAKALLEQKVKEATRQLKKQHKAQQNFFIDLAHELKTPLTIMKGSLDLALGKNGKKIRKNFESFTRFHETQKEEVDRIDKIINDLSILAKADTKQLALQFQKIRLDKLLEKVCLRLRAIAEQEKKKLECKEPMPLTVMGDKERLEQLISNLLDNAIKFTKPESGRIQLSLTKDQNIAKMQIQDNGVGIPKKDLPHIFDRFYRGDNARRHPKLRGSGLGLAICDWIVKEHHGKITVKSTSGKGTILTVSLPLISKNTSQ